MKKRILLVSPILSRSGYGVHARTVFRALKQHESLFDIYAINIPWGATSMVTQDDKERAEIDGILLKTIEYQKSGGQFDISVQVTIPNEFQKRAPINIGVTAGIETTQISPAWIEKSMLMDKIIVVSNHAKDGFENTTVVARNSKTGEVVEDFRCKTPISVIGYPVCKFEPDENFKIDLQTKFNYLLMAQWGPRKNIENTIGWFLEEMQEQEDVGLICKINIANDSLTDSLATRERIEGILAKFPNRKCKIYLLTGDLDEGQLAALYTHGNIKALISISHGESWDLPAFEAAYYGLPVITVTYGGHSDFLFMPRKDKKRFEFVGAKVDYDVAQIQPQAIWNGVLEQNLQWAYPKRNSYREKLREVYREYKRFKAGSKRLQGYLEKNFTREEIYKKFAEVISGEKIVEIKKEELEKVSVITSVFKGAEYMEAFFKDITRQTIFPQCELIMINANSPEKAEEEKIIFEWMKKYPNIIYKTLDSDPGLYGVWNLGVKMSTGTLITNWNLDDRRAPYNLEKCAGELFLNKEIAGVYTDSFITDKPNETWEQNSSNGRKYNFPQYSFESLKMMCLLHATPMWRKSLHDKYGFFDEQYKSASDWKFWLWCAYHGEKYMKIDDPMSLYYFSPRGISTNVANFKEKRREEKEVYEFFKEKEIL